MKRFKIFHFLIFNSLCIVAFVIIFLETANQINLIPDKNVKQKTCGRFPLEEHITIDNTIWQILETSKGFVKILNAYLDTRQNLSVVRLNVNTKELNKTDFFYCQFWFDDVSEPTIVKSSEVLLIWVFKSISNGFGVPYLIECPFNGTVPTSVSLVANQCDHAENNLKILDPKPIDGVKKRFGVCSKQATFEGRDFAMRVIEWVHLVNILGAEKVHFYYEYVHPDIFHVMNYFEKKGLVEGWPYFDPSGIRDSNPDSWQSMFLQVNMLTDCFYRVKNLYDFVAILDFDEVIMPRIEEDRSWEDILKRLNLSKNYDAYVSQNVYYPEVGAKLFEEFPKYMYMLQHVQRSQNFSVWGAAVKSIFRSERVLSIHNHAPQQCINDKHFCHRFEIPTNISQNSHYRQKMIANTKFDITQVDNTVWKFKDQLIKAVHETMRATNFVP